MIWYVLVILALNCADQVEGEITEVQPMPLLLLRTGDPLFSFLAEQIILLAQSGIQAETYRPNDTTRSCGCLASM